VAKLAYASRALDDLVRLATFLVRQDPHAALATIDLVRDALAILERHPLVGRKVERGHERELVISRGRSGYLGLYAYDPATDEVLVLAIRHQREAGYEED
jgi:plasmid stabilization system protein ParE